VALAVAVLMNLETEGLATHQAHPQVKATTVVAMHPEHFVPVQVGAVLVRLVLTPL